MVKSHRRRQPISRESAHKPLLSAFVNDKVVCALGGSLFLATLVAFWMETPPLFDNTNLPQFRFQSVSRAMTFSSLNQHRVKRPLAAQWITMELGGARNVQLPDDDLTIPEDLDFGSLELEFLSNDYSQRVIWNKGIGPGPKIQDQSYNSFYVTDDDFLLQDEYLNYGHKRGKKGRVEPTDCRYPSMSQVKPNCNTFHEVGFEQLIREGRGGHVGGGDYKQVFSIVTESEKLIMKEASLDGADFTYTRMMDYEMDGIVRLW